MNFKRKKPRSHSSSQRQCSGGSRSGSAPGHWNIIFNNRPKRRRDKANCVKAMQSLDPDSIIWELGNRKPHEYYW